MEGFPLATLHRATDFCAPPPKKNSNIQDPRSKTRYIEPNRRPKRRHFQDPISTRFDPRSKIQNIARDKRQDPRSDTQHPRDLRFFTWCTVRLGYYQLPITAVCLYMLACAVQGTRYGTYYVVVVPVDPIRKTHQDL